MKKVFAVLFTVLAFGCNSDDNDQVDNGLHNPYTGGIVGLWKAIGADYNGAQIPVDCDSEITPEQEVWFMFNEDNTFTLDYNCGDELISKTGTYTKTGNVLKLMIDENEEKAHMVELVAENPETETPELTLEWRFGIGSGGILEDFDLVVQKMPAELD